MRKLFILFLMLITITLAGEGKFGSVTYFDYTYNATKDAANDAGFEIHRVYFTYQQEISDGIKFRFTTDVGRQKGDSKNPNLYAYLKYAKIDWKSPVGKLTFGLQGLNIFNIQEYNWGFRFMEKSPMDLNKWASSADLGVGYSNKFIDKLHLSALYTNGSGYKKPENDSYKKLSMQVYYGEKKLTQKDGFNIGGLFAYEPYDYEADTVTTEKKSKTTLGVFGAYAGSGLRAGGEIEQFSDKGSDISKQIIAVYANYKIADKISLYGRYDLYDPDTGTGENGENYLIAGIYYSPGKGLVIAPNIRYTSFEDNTKDAETLYKVNFEFKF